MNKTKSTDPLETLQVALIQMTSVDDSKVNLAQILKSLKQLDSQTQLDLVCLPENSLFMKIRRDDRGQSFDLSEDIFKDLQNWVDFKQCPLMLGSIPYRDKLGVHNATIYLSPANLLKAVYQKIHLFDVDVDGEKSIRESDQFVHGSTPQILNLNGWRLGLSICYDLRFPELYSQYRDQVDVLMVPSAFLVPTGKAHWEVLLRARAIENQCYVLAAAQAGVHQGVQGGQRETYGHSMVVGPWGMVLKEASATEVEVLVVELKYDDLKKVRAQIPMENHRRLPI